MSHHRLLSAALGCGLLVACQQAPEAASPTEPAPVAVAPQASTASPATETDPALTAFLTDFMGEYAADTRTVVRTHGTNADKLTFVYLMGPAYCGTGGCKLLVLSQGADGYDMLGEISRVSTPVRVLTTRTNGRPDIGISVSGGGGPAPFEALMAFDGRAYPRFPGEEALTGAEGDTVMTDADLPRYS